MLILLLQKYLIRKDNKEDEFFGTRIFETRITRIARIKPGKAYLNRYRHYKWGVKP